MEQLISDCLRRLEDEGEVGLREFLAAHPGERAELEAHLAELREAGLLTPPDELGVPRRLGEFEVGERLGGGGMGVVHRAWQASLGREVALKVIRPDRVHLDTARRRFRLEAEAIARLAHPGIVPVYAFGEDGGLPWFAMELIGGATFADALAWLAGTRPTALLGADLARAVRACMQDGDGHIAPSPARAASWPEVCARVVARIADAVAAAHEHGVLHRDLKPSNVMLTPDDRVLLFDFGLTRSDGDDRTLTRDGDLVGSPAYMAPEQLRGGRIDERTDVYALGVTLYEALALELPFLADDEHELRNRIVAGDSVPLRHRNPRVSWELETVCAVAMDRDAARRYPTARALRDDLERVLAREPIVARRPGPWLRTRRFAQRYPARVVAVAAALAAVVAIPTLLGLREASARRRIEAEHAVGERHLQTALEAMDRFLSRFGSEELAYAPGVADVGRALLEDSIRLHEQLSRDRPDDPRVLLGLSEARRRAAWHALRIGDLDDAAARAIAAAEPVAASGDTAFALQLASALRTAAAVDRARGDETAAEQRLRRALVACSSLAEGPTRESLMTALVATDLGRLLTDRGAHDEARALLERAVEAFDASTVGGTETSSSRAQALRCLATVCYRCGDSATGEVALRSALAALEARMAESSDPPPGIVSMMAQVLLRLGTGAPRERALPVARRALELVVPLAERYPEVVSYRVTAVEAHLLAAQCAEGARARRSIAEAAAIAAGLPRGRVETELLEVRIARHAYDVVRGADDAPAAVERLRRSVERFDRRPPAAPYDRLELAMAWHSLGVAALDARSFVAAAAAFRRSLELKEPLLAEIGQGVVATCARTRSALADALLGSEPEAALVHARSAVDELAAPKVDAPDDLFEARITLALALQASGRLDETVDVAEEILAADTDPEHALGAARVLVRVANSSPQDRDELLRRAVEAVGIAANRGYRDVDTLLSSGELAPLRVRRDFVPVVRQVRDGH